MRIAFVAPAHPYRGGIAHFGVRLAREMSQRHEIRYINFSRLYPEFLFPGKTQFDESKESLDIQSERSLDSISPLSWRRVGRQLRRWGADVILFHWWHPFFAPAYRWVASNADRNSLKLSVCHNVIPHESGAIQRYMVKYGLNIMDGVVIHARSEERDVSSLLPGTPQLTLFHPIYDIFDGEKITRDEARAALDIQPDVRMALYFGLVRPYKGVEVLLESARQLRTIDRLRLFIVGEIYSNRREIMSMAEAAGSFVNVIDRYVPNEEVALWFRAADLVVLPYLTATQSGIVPIAYRCGRPVVVTRVGGLPDVVIDGKSGYVVEPGDSAGLSSAIRSHFEKPTDNDMTQGVDRMCRELSWENYTEKLEAFIERLREEQSG